jgi:hypothetical protein
MNKDRFTKKLEISNEVKWLLFNKLREEFEKINFLDYRRYKEDLERIPDLLITEWEKIKKRFQKEPAFESRNLRGFLFEALFYYACLKIEALFKDAEILEMEGRKIRNEYPPWFEATPLYDVIPPLHHFHKRGKIIRNPQTKCDFLVTFVNDKGPLPPALVDVKSNKPRRDYIKKFDWQVISAMRRGFIFQFAYPKEGIKYPKSLEEWEIMTFCSKCKELSKSYRKCDKCGEIIFSFTIVDTYYRKK